jgi:toxin CcdB
MPQFSVHRNPNPRTKATYPYLVNVQSDLLDGLSTRVVVPLAKVAVVARKPIKQLTPIVEVEKQKFIMLVPQLAGVAAKDLGPVVTVIEQHRAEFIAAIDLLITGI